MNREKSQKYFEDAQKKIPGGVDSPARAFNAVGGNPIFIEKAKNQFIYDVDGNKYLDFVLTWGPAILGHAHPEVCDFVKKYVDNGMSFGMPSPIETKLAQKISELLPYIEMTRFVSSGTEATMTAIRLARGITQKNKIIKFKGCYHGHNDALLVKAGSAGATLGVPDSAGVTPGTAQDTIICDYNNIEEVKSILLAKDIAAVIIEPIAGNMGLIKPKKDFLKDLRNLCSEHDALLIFDEVMTGFRIHKQGAYGLYGITPDITTFGKVIGGGMPVGAIAGKEKVMNYLAPVGPVYQAGTLSGNPVAMACGLKTLEIFQSENVSEYLQDISDYFKSKMDAITKKYDHVSFSIQCSMFTLFFRKEIPQNFAEISECKMDTFSAFFTFMLDNGILIPPSQYEANFLSLKHTKKDIDYYCNSLESFLSQ